jgi:hypothetical protein
VIQSDSLDQLHNFFMEASLFGHCRARHIGIFGKKGKTRIGEARFGKGEARQDKARQICPILYYQSNRLPTS